MRKTNKNNSPRKTPRTPKRLPNVSQRPQRPPRARLADAHYMLALGSLGLGDRTQAELEFARALDTSPDLLGARTALAALRR